MRKHEELAREAVRIGSKGSLKELCAAVAAKFGIKASGVHTSLGGVVHERKRYEVPADVLAGLKAIWEATALSPAEAARTRYAVAEKTPKTPAPAKPEIDPATLKEFLDSFASLERDLEASREAMKGVAAERDTLADIVKALEDRLKVLAEASEIGALEKRMREASARRPAMDAATADAIKRIQDAEFRDLLRSHGWTFARNGAGDHQIWRRGDDQQITVPCRPPDNPHSRLNIRRHIVKGAK